LVQAQAYKEPRDNQSIAVTRAIFDKSGDIRVGKKEVTELTYPALCSEGSKFKSLFSSVSLGTILWQYLKLGHGSSFNVHFNSSDTKSILPFDSMLYELLSVIK
jgi:hypothetical protein